jgi:hypothetical protein
MMFISGPEYDLREAAPPDSGAVARLGAPAAAAPPSVL